MSNDDGTLSGQAGSPGSAQVLQVGAKLFTLVRDQNFQSVKMLEPKLSQCGKGLSDRPGGNVSRDR